MVTEDRKEPDIPNGVITHPDATLVKIDPGSSLSNGQIAIHTSYQANPLKTLIYSEVFKTIVCFLYTHTALFTIEFAIAVVQFRIPDREKHPPLPDIVLDNLQRVAWGHNASETMMALAFGTLCIVIFLHKYRVVILRRFGCLLSVMFVTRAITILLTALPVPCSHQECNERGSGSWSEYYELSKIIAHSRGFKLAGLKTCGDYMFSGHTVGLTLFPCFVREYTPQRWTALHICMWICNLFGMYAILAAHGHYSIDVFIAFVMTYRTFHFYHSLASNRASPQGRNRKLLMFPFFDYFEPEHRDIIPNTYGWPLTRNNFNELLKNIKETLDLLMIVCKCKSWRHESKTKHI